MARKQKFSRLSAHQANAALRWLHATGKVTATQIAVALRKREALVAEIKARLEELGGEGGRFLTGPAALQRRPSVKRRPRKASAKAQAAWRAQGRYLGAVRRLSKADRARVKGIREKSGVRAAIAAARKLAPRK